jgi:hypothetical protein
MLAFSISEIEFIHHSPERARLKMPISILCFECSTKAGGGNWLLQTGLAQLRKRLFFVVLKFKKPTLSRLFRG